MAARKKAPQKRGPKGPRLTLTDKEFKQVCAMAERWNTSGDIAIFFDMSPDTLQRRLKERGVNFADLIAKRRAATATKLRGIMLGKAFEGDNTMLVWTSKNLLGWSDKQHVDHSSLDGTMTPQTIITAEMSPTEAMAILRGKVGEGKG